MGVVFRETAAAETFILELYDELASLLNNFQPVHEGKVTRKMHKHCAAIFILLYILHFMIVLLCLAPLYLR